MADRDPVHRIAATCAANSGALVTVSLTPLVIAGLILGLGLNEPEAGSLITLEVTAMGISALALAPLLVRFSRRALGLSMATLVLAANAGAVMSQDIQALILWRVLAGLGAGALMATVNAVIAAAHRPTRLYGVAMMGAYASTAVLGIIISRIVEEYAYAGAYGVLAVFTLLILPLLAMLPGRLDTPERARDSHNAASAWACMVAIFLIGLSMMAYYAFVERLGNRLGMPIESIGWVFAAVQVASVLGSGAAAVIGERFGITKPLLAGTLLHAAAITIAVKAVNTSWFSAAVIAEGLTFLFILPLMFALVAQLDRSGRWAAAAGGVFLSSTAAGPLLGGVLLTELGYSALAWLAVIAAVPALVIFRWVGKQIPRDS